MDIGGMIASSLGQLWKVRDIWTYWPEGWFFKAVIFALVLVAVPSIYFRIWGQSNHEAYLLRAAHRTQIAALKIDLYKPQGPLIDAAEGVPGSIAPLKPEDGVQLYAKDGEQLPDGTLLRDAALVTPHDVSRFTFMLLPSQSAWQKGSATEFEGLDSTPVDIETALKKDYVETLVRRSDRIVCIGLASAEPAPEGKNLRYSDDRAINLCNALFNIGYASETAQAGIGLSLGEYQRVEGEVAATSLQRAAILVGLQNSARYPRTDTLVRALWQMLKVPGVNLERYKRSDGYKYMRWSGLTGGALTGVVGSKWHDSEEIDVDAADPFESDEPATKPVTKQ